jgi:hypothetical protein
MYLKLLSERPSLAVARLFILDADKKKSYLVGREGADMCVARRAAAQSALCARLLTACFPARRLLDSRVHRLMISRKHATIEFDAARGVWHLADSSVNGVYVNGARRAEADLQ